MSLPIALAGALFLTFFVSRLFLRILPGSFNALVRVGLAHLMSLIALGLIAALTKAHSEFLREDAALIYIVPQLIWLAVDIYIAGPRRRPGQGSAQRR